MDLFEHFKGKNIYHISDSDLDGISCRVIAEHLISPVAKVIYLNSALRDMSDVEVKTALASDIVIFTDIAPTPDLYDFLIKNNISVFIFDHHQTSRDILGELPNYYFSLEKCGSKIFFDELTRDKKVNRCLNQYVELVDIYDRYETNSLLWNEAKFLQFTMYGYIHWFSMKDLPDTIKYNDFIKVQLSKFKENKKFALTLYEQDLARKGLEKENKAYKEAIKNLDIRQDSEGVRYAYTECTSKISLVSYRILKEMSDRLDYLAIRGTFDKESMKISLRSNIIDVAKIAEKWNGGGHISAAGFSFINRDDFTRFKFGELHLK